MAYEKFYKKALDGAKNLFSGKAENEESALSKAAAGGFEFDNPTDKGRELKDITNSDREETPKRRPPPSPPPPKTKTPPQIPERNYYTDVSNEALVPEKTENSVKEEVKPPPLPTKPRPTVSKPSVPSAAENVQKSKIDEIAKNFKEAKSGQRYLAYDENDKQLFDEKGKEVTYTKQSYNVNGNERSLIKTLKKSLKEHGLVDEKSKDHSVSGYKLGTLRKPEANEISAKQERNKSGKGDGWDF